MRRKDIACNFNLFFYFSVALFFVHFFSQPVCWISLFLRKLPSKLFLILTACWQTPTTRQLLKQLLLSRVRIPTAYNRSSWTLPLVDHLTRAKQAGQWQVPNESIFLSGIRGQLGWGTSTPLTSKIISEITKNKMPSEFLDGLNRELISCAKFRIYKKLKIYFSWIGHLKFWTVRKWQKGRKTNIKTYKFVSKVLTFYGHETHDLKSHEIVFIPTLFQKLIRENIYMPMFFPWRNMQVIQIFLSKRFSF